MVGRNIGGGGGYNTAEKKIDLRIFVGVLHCKGQHTKCTEDEVNKLYCSISLLRLNKLYACLLSRCLV